MNWIPLSIVCIYIIILFVITWTTRRLSRGGMIAYLLAGRNLPFWVVVPLLIGLTLTTAYTLVMLMTLFWPQICRQSHAVWTLLMAMIALATWMIFPQISSVFRKWGLIHPIYFCWMVSIATFFLVAVIDKRKIKGGTNEFGLA